ncbi:MAG: hypothetical protein HGA80_05935, partial [Candidatus Omnitrophica bacterium]|nr:hypothetical protein [Candidatus Omnitrophota bacterium]
GDRIAFNDMMNRGSWTLKPWEAHVYRLQRKGVAAAVAANAGTGVASVNGNTADSAMNGGIDVSGMNVEATPGGQATAANWSQVVLSPSFAGFHPVLVDVTTSESAR